MVLRYLNPFRKKRPLVPIVRLTGVISSSSGGNMKRSLNMTTLAPLLEKAFSMKRAKAVALQVNSPGGSPVQSALIFERVRYLAAKKNLPVLSFVEDIAASGGYWLACAGDEIYVNGASVIGSIGVVSAGFGFEEAIEKLGIKRRVYTAGERKAMLDPFRPEQDEDVAHLKELQADIHAQFSDAIRQRRGKNLKGEEGDLFSGAFWTGRQAISLGLVDKEGEMRQVLEERFGEKVQLKFLQPSKGFFSLPFGASLGGHAQAEIEAGVDSLVEQVMRSRYGL